jgi:hypothetical protein
VSNDRYISEMPDDRNTIFTNDPAGFLALHGWCAEVNDFDAVARRFGCWPPPGISVEVAKRSAAASRSFFISAERMIT